MEIPGYQIKRLIAEGGMSTVYLAVQESLGRQVAIKVLTKFDSSQQAERFLREARVIAALEHRNIITIYDVGAVGERNYIAMEYLEEGSLAERIQHGMDADTVLDLLERIAGCLDFVHRRDVIHRDIKPSNILFHADGTPRLTDFGIAKQLDRDQELTLDDSAFGSPYYLSPEQAEGRPLDGRSDIYSLGIVFYQMLTGRKPYAESSHIETIVAHLSNPIPMLPKGLSRYQDLLEQMIAKHPENRVASAQALIALIRATRSAASIWKGGLVPARRLGGVVADQPGERTGLLARVRAASPRTRVLAASLALVAVIGIAWLPDDGANEQEIAALAPRAPALELRYDQDIDGRGRSFTVPAPMLQSEPRVVESALEPADPGPRSGTLSPGNSERSDLDQLAADMIEETMVEPIEDPVAESAGDFVPHAGVGMEGDVAAASGGPVTEFEPETGPSEDLQARVAALMRAGNRAMKRNRLTRPATDNAYGHYSEVVEIVPDHQGANAGIDRIAGRYVALARGALGRKDYRKARVYTRRGLTVRSGYPDLIAIRKEIAASERMAKRASTEKTKVAAVPPPGKPRIVSREIEGTSVTSRGPEGTGNIVKDFKNVWRSVFD